MLFNTEKLKDNFPADDLSDDTDVSMSSSSDISDSSVDSDDSDSESHSVNENPGGTSPSTSTILPDGSREQLPLNEDDEEDEVVKAIIRSKEIQRDHPPVITVEDFVVDVCFHPVNDLVAFANITGDVLLYKYSVEEVELVSTMELHLKACRDIEFSEDGKILYSTAKDKSIMLTDLETEKLVRYYENAHEEPVYTMTIINENTFATGDDYGVVKLWDLRDKSNMPIFSLKKMEDYVSAMVTNSDKKYLICASGDGSLTTLNIPAKKMHTQSEEYEEEFTCLGLFRSETKLLAPSSKGKMYIFNWGEFGLHSDELPSLTKKSINCMIPITENIVVTGGEDGMLRATHLFPHRHLGIVGQHNFSIEALDINNDGTLIASSSHDNNVKFWNVQYFETLSDAEPVKGGKQKQIKHNLPSSKVDNASNFFADL